MPYKGNKRKKRRTHQPETDDGGKTPKSFVFTRGQVSPAVEELARNIRKIMSPNTAVQLKVKKSNRMKDFVNIAGPLGVTHLWILTQSELGVNLRLLRLPHGPTLTFRVNSYSQCRDVLNTQKRPEDVNSGILCAPLVILNNFSEGDEKQIMGAMLQNMFPPLKVKKIRLSQCTRVCLFDYDTETDRINLRHYRIKASPVGINRNIKRVIKAKKLPNLSKYKDISQYVDDKGYVTSDSEAEDTEENRMLLPQDYSGKGNRANQKSAIRLKEIGPRITLELLKIQEGIDDGAVLFHKFITKTEKEVSRLGLKKEKGLSLKRKRKREQEKNVESKKEAKRQKKRQRKENWLTKQTQLAKQTLMEKQELRMKEDEKIVVEEDESDGNVADRESEEEKEVQK